jgi:hypothetical protein
MFEQHDLLQSTESHQLFEQVKDDTSSLLWLRDAESCGTHRSTAVENLELMDIMFDFDHEIFRSKVYRMATRSNMIHALLSDTSENGQPVNSFPGTVTDSHDSTEPDNDETDVQTIREQPIDTSRPDSGRQSPTVEGSQGAETSGSIEVSRDVRLEKLPSFESQNRQPKSASTHRKEQGSAKARKQVYRKLLHVPSWFMFRPPSSITSQQARGDDKAAAENKPVKVLILGSSQSGKSTLMKSLYADHEGYTDDMRALYTLTIFKNTVDSMRALLSAREIFRLEEENKPEAQAFEVHRQIIYESYPVHGGEGKYSASPRNLTDFLSFETAFAIMALWKDPSVRETFESERSNEYYLMDCAE